MDFLNAGEIIGATMTGTGGIGEGVKLAGHYDMVCTDSEGNVLWEEGFDNLVTTIGKNLLIASGVTAVSNPFMGLMGVVTTGPNASDTMTSHSGWIECAGTNEPVYTGNRPAVTWGAPAGGVVSTTSTDSFVFSASGTVNGGFIVMDTGAVNTPGSTAGALFSAGTIAGQPVISGNTITMSYTLTLP